MTAVRVGPHTIEVSNVDKVLFPDDGITKGDVVDYYERIADQMVPHLEGRPLALHRFPDGIKGDGFFQKTAPEYFPDGARNFFVTRLVFVEGTPVAA